MTPEIMNEDNLPLSEYIKLPTTVDFEVINTIRFRKYAEDKPYLHFGTELANNYVVGYTNIKYLDSLKEELGSDFFSYYPKIMSPLGVKGNDNSGITQVLNQPFLNLSGRGVIIGFIDTGIDYTLDAFKFEDGTSKISYIWDQTIDGSRPDYMYYGSTYSREQINEALRSPTPFQIVPTIDEDGHGTFLASIAASNEKGVYIGAAPQASLVVVKLRRARQFYIDRYLLSPDNPNLYQSTDFMLGIKYVLDRAHDLGMPAVICIGMGSNLSSHDGDTLSEDYISFFSGRSGYSFAIAAGNESNAKHHTQGNIPHSNSIEKISINVGQQGASFTVTIFSAAFDKMSVGVVSPIGEAIPRIPFRSGLEYSERMFLGDTTVFINYYRDNNNNIMIGLKNATQGIWDINLFGDNLVIGDYFAWLPITGQVIESVQFVKPVPEYTIVYPGNAMRSSTCGAYNSDDNSLYVSSSWGPTRVPRMAPDFVAPGVNISGIYPTGYGTMTGTSVSAALAAGASALLMEWGIVQKNMPTLDGDVIRNLLIGGCTRDENQVYPNIRWGYGKLNLYRTFQVIGESISDYERYLTHEGELQ